MSDNKDNGFIKEIKSFIKNSKNFIENCEKPDTKGKTFLLMYSLYFQNLLKSLNNAQSDF